MIGISAFIALFLRDNLEINPARVAALGFYTVATLVIAAIAMAVLRVDRISWRLGEGRHHARLFAAVLVTVLGAMAATFAYDRMDDVPRSLPIIHAICAMCLMIGVRELVRLRHVNRQSRKRKLAPFQLKQAQAEAESVLIVGSTRLTETYLQSALEMGSGRVAVVGLLTAKERYIGRLVEGVEVLGVPEDIERVVAELELKGIAVDRIVVASRVADLSGTAREALDRVERASDIAVQFLAVDLGFEGSGKPDADSEQLALRFVIPPDMYERIAKSRYWPVKRAIDIVGAVALLVLLSPFFLLAAGLVLIGLGAPLTFTQRRPGLAGVPFRLLKFRTMAPAHARDGRRLSEADRTTAIGNFLRRTRLDELPQLWNILRGEMSFVGPRPLLPRDQSAAYRARLLVRPGLTGWAQVIGGRAISPEQKAALDVWYVGNADLWLDLETVLRTMPIVVFGETTRTDIVARAFDELRAAGMLNESVPAELGVPAAA